MPGARYETHEHDGVAPEEIPETTAGGPAAPAVRGTGRRARRIVAWTAVGTLVLLVVSGGAIYYHFNSNIRTFPAEALSADRPPAAEPDATGNTPVNVLLIGSDSRGGNNSSLGGGESGTARSDTTILLHVYADHRHAIGVSIPRDTLVTIPSCRLPDGTWTEERSHTMFNEAFSVGETDAGNPACTQNTVEKLTGLRVDHTIVANFEGFAAMTKAVHGVEVCLPNDIYDRDVNPNLGARGNLVLSKGRQSVQGQQALDYVRLRHGIGDGSDIGRMLRQQAFLGSLVSKIKGQGINPTTLLPLAEAVTKSLIVDPGLDSVAKLLEFGSSLKHIDLHELKFLTTPWRFSGERVELVHPDVDTLWATLRADLTIDGQDAAGTTTTPPATPTPSASTKPTGTPTALPSTVLADARSADQDTCANTVFGSGG
ncbi:LCP family protein [Streptomyces sp. H39-S7]|uniref:LCP family protein n=1 Tax=Streptomyces sp. H39-S7 TaxID=3004357 RepID=UPI0022B05F7E|nr:LCP family protein [Streptomyces sp. H39-S7]MCZ4122000.1 LCP family protein [Streptomyces sp. H39-S7]